MSAQPKPINPLLAKYLHSLATRPLLTKACTAGTLSTIQELLAGKITGAAPAPYKKTGIFPVDFVKANAKVFKMGSYGFFVSAPMGHTLLTLLQKAFAGHTSARARILQIVCSNLFVSPIQQSVYLLCMAYINGAKNFDQASKFVKLGFWRIMKITWVVSPVSMTIAQKFLDPPLWVPFFNLVAFVLGIYINVQTKRKQIALAKEKAKRDAEKQT